MTDSFTVPAGIISVTTYGSIQAETARCMWESRAFCDQQGLKNIRWTTTAGALVDRARNDLCRQMLKDPNCGFVLMVDGDMVWPVDAVFRLIQTAFGTNSWADVVGGYANLRGEIAIPTLDTGTGTWETHYPGSGVKEVMRTGGAFLLVKRHVCERIPDPWFALRVPIKPLDAMAEVDNFARCKFDGANPLRTTPEWAVLEEIARSDPSAHTFIPSEVGEDSGFCDRVKLAGMRIVVDTNVVTGHLHTQEVNWRTHKDAMAKREKEQAYAVGLL